MDPQGIGMEQKVSVPDHCSAQLQGNALSWQFQSCMCICYSCGLLLPLKWKWKCFCNCFIAFLTLKKEEVLLYFCFGRSMSFELSVFRLFLLQILPLFWFLFLAYWKISLGINITRFGDLVILNALQKVL